MKILLITLFLALSLFAFDLPLDPFRVNDNRLDELLREPNNNHEACIITDTEDTTYISGGTLYGEHHWTKEGSPYLIEGDVTVDSFSVLEVDAGVDILFRYDPDYYRLEVNGVLKFWGTIEDSIYVGPENSDLRDEFGYAGIGILESAQACSVQFINMVQAGSFVNQAQHTYVEGCNFKFLGQTIWGYPTGISTYTDSLTVRNCTFQGLAEGEEGQMIDGIYVAGEASYLDVSTSSFFAHTAITVEAEDVFARIDSSYFGGDGMRAEPSMKLMLIRCYFNVNYPIYI